MTEGFDWLEAQHLLIENDELRQRVEELERENGLLRSALKESDTEFIDEPDSIRNDLQDSGYLLPVEREERDGAEHDCC